ncbi:uncharacterized protein LOC124405255 [Diprion similis]|uniref:uncharacterized protein LOC124405255 n=1 Tax=Diprion similis TaxID=362088 RepID=UPI001EF8B2EB|nr:uncharacterized protein LOC124405255 [Diprion similis]
MDCPMLISNLRKPRIYWYQTDAEIVIRIILHDVEDYFLSVRTDELEFSTSLEGIDYYIYLYLFGAVIAEKTIHKTTGRELTVYLQKVQKWTPWPRLLYSSIAYPHVYVDLDHLASIKPKKDIDWNEREDFATFKRKHDISYIRPDVPSSNEDESAGEENDMIFDY